MKKIIYITLVATLNIVVATAQTIFVEDFDTALPSSWTIDATHGVEWKHSDSLGANNTGCAYVDKDDTFGLDSGSIETVAIDLTKINKPVLSFKVATVRKNFAVPQLHLHYNIGNGWSRLNTWGLWGVDSIIASTEDFFPPLDKKNVKWEVATYDLSSLSGNSNIRFAFGAYVDNGGYLLLDSIRISDPSTLSIAQYEQDRAVVLYPNPAQDRVYITTGTAGSAAIYVYDITGRQMSSVTYKWTGKQLEVNTTTLSNGTYYIHIVQAGSSEAQKLVISR
ncbi:MAG: T9SS type A sorting domain-containing protein [Flavipsychrobacter sp.]